MKDGTSAEKPKSSFDEELNGGLMSAVKEEDIFFDDNRQLLAELRCFFFDFSIVSPLQNFISRKEKKITDEQSS